jgi:hypothetical protein
MIYLQTEANQGKKLMKTQAGTMQLSARYFMLGLELLHTLLGMRNLKLAQQTCRACSKFHSCVSTIVYLQLWSYFKGMFPNFWERPGSFSCCYADLKITGNDRSWCTAACSVRCLTFQSKLS